MKFLCLHGTDTNSEILEMQLCTLPNMALPPVLPSSVAALNHNFSPAPLTFPLIQEKHTFTYLNGPLTSSTAAPGLSDFPGPYHRYYDRKQLDTANLPPAFAGPSPSIKTPEDWMRQLRAHNLEHDRTTSGQDFVLDFMEKSPEGPFDAIIGFSEGALIAADIILHQNSPSNPFPRAEKIKLGIFICGAPAWDYKNHRSLLADETEERIKIPTLNIIGKKDPIAKTGRALARLCEGGAVFEWDGGHVVPRGADGDRMLGRVRRLINRVRMGG